VLRGQDHDALAEITERKERIARDSCLCTASRVLMPAAIGVETGAVVGIERGRGGKIHPVFVQQALAPDDAIIEESRPKRTQSLALASMLAEPCNVPEPSNCSVTWRMPRQAKASDCSGPPVMSRMIRANNWSRFPPASV
jgi:hypothetical protein